MNNYFSVFDLPLTFDLDLADLEKRYFTVQRLCHPDRLIGKPPAQRQQAIAHSMLANEAFEALKYPLQRARHLLALQGIHVGSERDSLKPTPALLMEVMELREALEEVGNVDALERFAHTLHEQIGTLLPSLSQAFSQQQWQEAAQHTLRLGYLQKIEEEIRLKRKALALS